MREKDVVMDNNQSRGKSQAAVPGDRAGMKRRDLLLSGSSLLAASVLGTSAPITV